MTLQSKAEWLIRRKRYRAAIPVIIRMIDKRRRTGVFMSEGCWPVSFHKKLVDLGFAHYVLQDNPRTYALIEKTWASLARRGKRGKGKRQ